MPCPSVACGGRVVPASPRMVLLPLVNSRKVTDVTNSISYFTFPYQKSLTCCMFALAVLSFSEQKAFKKAQSSERVDVKTLVDRPKEFVCRL